MRKKVPILTDSVTINSFVEKLNRHATIEIIDELTGYQYSRNSLLGIYSDWNRYHAFCTKTVSTHSLPLLLLFVVFLRLNPVTENTHL